LKADKWQTGDASVFLSHSISMGMLPFQAKHYMHLAAQDYDSEFKNNV